MHFVNDLRVAVRSLARTPAFTALAAGVLGLGIGTVVVMYAVVDVLLNTPPPLPQVERLVTIGILDRARNSDDGMPLHDLEAWGRSATSFEGLAGFYGGTVMVSGDGPAERYDGGFVTGPWFEMIRERPLLGRTLLESDARPGAAPAVVLAEDLWRTRFAADPAVVGRALRVNGAPATIVGVMPSRFDLPSGTQLWTADRTATGATTRAKSPEFEGLARLRDGVSMEAAQAELSAIRARETARDPALAGLEPDVRPLSLVLLGRDGASFMHTLLASVFLVLAIACVNVAGLLLVRAAGRRQEAAVRRALGAGRARLAFQMLAESLVIGAATALIGLTLAAAGLEVFGRVLPGAVPTFPKWWSFGVRPNVVAFAVALAGASALLAGVYPAVRASGVNLDAVLREGTRDTGIATGRIVRWLVVVEIALSCALLTSAGIVIRVASDIATGDVGVDVRGFLGGRIGLPAGMSAYGEDAQVRFAERLEERLARIPGVEAAAIASAAPGLGSAEYRYALSDRTYATHVDHPSTDAIHVSPGFFGAFRIPAREGRVFGREDRAGAVPVAVVNETLAAAAWPGESAVGKRIRVDVADPDSPWLTVVGVVQDVRHATGLDAMTKARPVVYLPFSQRPVRFFTAVMRGPADPLTLAGPLRDAVRELDPDLAVYWVRTIEAWRRVEAGGFMVIGGMFSVFGVVAILLAASGIYGVLAASVAQGTREIAIRRALGAPGARIAMAVVGRSAWQLGIGLTVGLVLAPATGAAFGAAIGEDTHDPAVYATIVVVLSLAIVLATLVPLRRALRLDPASALRYG